MLVESTTGQNTYDLAAENLAFTLQISNLEMQVRIWKKIAEKREEILNDLYAEIMKKWQVR